MPKAFFRVKSTLQPHAVKTEGTQLHKALLLSDSTEIDVKPELEIFADDVKCSHGAASGELDEEQLFYMQARGIGRDEAKQLLIDAYLEDVLLPDCFRTDSLLASGVEIAIILSCTVRRQGIYKDKSSF